MQKNNTVFLCDKELADVVVFSDTRGNHNLMSSLKYNRLVNVQSASHLFNKNTLLVRDKQLKDALIVSDCHGNNTITTMSETSDSGDSGERNVFMEVLHRVQREQNQATIDNYLQEKRQSLQDKLKTATDLYISGNYIKSLEYYRHALTMIESDSYPDEFRLENSDVFRIKYALVLSNIGLNLYGPLKTACEMCSTLILTYGAEYPSLYFTLGRAKMLLKLYESARIAAETGLSVLDECVVLSHLTFPASNHIIPDTDPTTLLHNLEKTLEDATNVPKPDVKCCYRLCIADSKAIYFDGPSFVGYVNVTCTERCQYNYHRSCWKIKLKTDRVKKPSAILNEQCQTDSCVGVISEIKIFDQRLKVNAAIRAKTGRGSSSVDNDKYSTDSSVVESRVYKTHFQLPTATVTSNLKPNATVFTPGKLQNITLLLKNGTKNGPRVFDSPDATNTNEETVTSEKTVIKSSLKPDVPEFLPAKVKQSVNSAENFTKWSTNAESTLENDVQPVLEADSDDRNANSSNCFPITNATSDFGDISEQPVPPCVEENGVGSLKLAEDKHVWTEPVTTQSVPAQCQVDTSSQQTQTPTHDCDSNELALLKCQIKNLKYSLWRAEDVNNLLQFERLPSDHPKSTAVAATQTDSMIDKRQKNCVKWIHSTCTPALCHADVLHTSNQQLEDDIKELKKSSRLEKDCFAECKRNYLTEIDDLKSTVSDLESELTAVRKEFQDYKKNNTTLSVNKILLEQIQCNKNFYLPYLKTFEDKCKHMIWELEDVVALTSPEGIPSKAEVEDSLCLWRTALADVESRQRIVLQHYETLLYNITSHQYTAVFQYPGQSLLVEPPNILLRHFKPMLINNRRLGQDNANQMTSFYKILSQSYTNVYPQQLAGVDLQNNIKLAGPWVKSASSDPVQAVENGQPLVAKAKMAEKPLVSAPTPALATLPSCSTAGSAQKGTKTRQSRAATDAEAAKCSPAGQQNKRPLPDLVGLDALIDKFQSQFPLIDGSVITEALFSIREQHGGLTGMSTKEILAEVKKYLRVKQQKNTVAAPPVNPWNTINTPVQWHSDQQDSGCTICFEKMTPYDSVTLKCQHLFHSVCIKIWLHSNSICPICRSFTTLDDEFPPLKLK